MRDDQKRQAEMADLVGAGEHALLTMWRGISLQARRTVIAILDGMSVCHPSEGPRTTIVLGDAYIGQISLQDGVSKKWCAVVAR
jgi:hypothetical protein